MEVRRCDPPDIDPVHFGRKLVTAQMPVTTGFVQRHANLFRGGEVIPGVGQHLTLREGAPVVAMLEAPEDFVEGSTEPWIVDILCALLKASDQRTVLECGAFVGSTTARLAGALEVMGGGSLVAVELDPVRATTAQNRLDGAAFPPTVAWQIVQDDDLKYIATVPDQSIGFAFLDDDHTKAHVSEEIEALLPKMAPNGLICGHDVWGSCDLQEIFTRYGGYALDLPRLGPAGGLGILQVR